LDLIDLEEPDPHESGARRKRSPDACFQKLWELLQFAQVQRPFCARRKVLGEPAVDAEKLEARSPGLK
jgi:hypothetical protein